MPDSLISADHETYMMQAIREAEAAFEEGEVPVGAVIVVQNRIIAKGHNQVERLNDPTAHAEMIALSAANNYLGSKYVQDAALYVTVEPCLMCAGALYWNKIGAIYYGTEDIKNGYRKHTGSQNPFHPKTLIFSGILQTRCQELMKSFFAKRR